MTNFTPTALVAIALTLGSSPLRAEIADLKWNQAGHAAHEFLVAPTKFAEWCGQLRAGEKVTWRFEAAAPVNFNIHYHAGKDVHYPARQDAVASSEGLLEVTVNQDYCWMWTNKSGTPVAVRVGATKVR